MLRIGICDDEAGARTALAHAVRQQLEPDGEDLTIYEFSSGEGALGWLDKHTGELDLLFLDIEMNGISGMETAQRIRQTDERLLLVFVTGYADFVFDGYAVSALDYIMKPVQSARLSAVLRRVYGALQRQSPQMYTLRNADGLYRVPKESILYLYSDKRLVTLVSRDREYIFYGRLDEVAQELGEGFVRIHQRYLVRGAAVDRIEGSSVRFGNAELPISRAHRQSAMLDLARTMLSSECASC